MLYDTTYLRHDIDHDINVPYIRENINRLSQRSADRIKKYLTILTTNLEETKISHTLKKNQDITYIKKDASSKPLHQNEM